MSASPALCTLALAAIATAFTEGVRRLPPVDALPAALARPGASFVTLELGDALLGCVGTLVATRPLAVDVAAHALGAAFDDPRVPTLTRDDYERMSVKVSVLAPPADVRVSRYTTTEAHDHGPRARPRATTGSGRR